MKLPSEFALEINDYMGKFLESETDLNKMEEAGVLLAGILTPIEVLHGKSEAIKLLDAYRSYLDEDPLDLMDKENTDGR